MSAANDTEPLHLGGPTEEALFAWRAGRLHPEALPLFQRVEFHAEKM